MLVTEPKILLSLSLLRMRDHTFLAPRPVSGTTLLERAVWPRPPYAVEAAMHAPHVLEEG